MNKNQRKDLLEMARVGYVKNLEIYVKANDGGNIPHFHIRDAVEWDKFNTCVEIEQAEYFHHGNKQDTLNTKQKVLLDNFMRSSVGKKYADKFKNNWDLVCFLWDLNNSNVSISDDAVQPDYTKL